ncbi:MAG: hydrogenase iron-sulfur subunit [Desulfobacterales bacterium]|nr:hydrogenase iron-sulfur subunit [Desulfobacterales bacterium]MBF0395677.1 hydrogenase iron-sulfur subunit [Desulfobacterales bacterium]
MHKNNIILYLCNWGPHVAFQDLLDKCADIPHEIKMIRIPCTGRISKTLLFKAFEIGADGVALVGCVAGTCRYGSGTNVAEKNVEDTRNILDLLGIGKERLELATFLPDDSNELLEFLKRFSQNIQKIGKSPIVHQKIDFEKRLISREKIGSILKKHNIYVCQDCGKCSSGCSLALSGKTFSPRSVANSLIAGDIYSENVFKDIWSCLTCGKCYDICPMAVNFPEFIRDIRELFRTHGMSPRETHGGFFQSLMRTMISPDIKPLHWQYLPEGIRLNKESKTLFFGGCSPYFDTFFRNHLTVSTFDIMVDSLKVLNFFDIEPAILENERCCGHDLLWSGDLNSFLELAKLNSNIINSKGFDTIVTSCPECLKTLLYDYPKYGIKLNPKVVHIYDLLESEIDKGAVSFKKFDKKMLFKEACRLDLGENEQSKKLVERFKKIQDISVIPNECCGNSSWVGCDAFSKALQTKQLKQARNMGFDLIVTSCPKCQIHLKCAMEDVFIGKELEIEMMDLTSVIAKTIFWT